MKLSGKTERVIITYTSGFEVEVPVEVLDDPVELLEAALTAYDENHVLWTDSHYYTGVEKANGTPLYEWHNGV